MGVFPQLLVGVTVSVTGLLDSDREVVRAAVEGRGGTYSADLTRACTHLLAASRGSQKYKAAKKWGLHCVRPGWLTTCCSKGARVSEKGYEVPDTAMEKDAVQSELILLSGMTGNTAAARRATQAGRGRGATEGGSQHEANTMTRQVNGSGRMGAGNCGGDARTTGREHGPDGAEGQVDCEYLSGIQVYIAGIEGQLRQDLIRALRRGGATRRSEMAADEVTHIIMNASAGTANGRLNPSDVAAVRKVLMPSASSVASAPFVVTPAWLLRCDAFRKLCTVELAETVSPEEIARAVGRNAMNYSAKAAAAAVHASIADDEVPLCNLGRGGSQLARQNSTTSGKAGPQNININNNASSQPALTERNGKQQMSAVFENLYFGVSLTVDSERILARDLIMKGGGSVQSGIVPLRREDYVVLPLGNPSLSNRRAGGAIQVTLMWLERCLEKSELVDPAATPLFSPLPHQLPLQDLNALRVCVSGYSGFERVIVERLAKELGCKFNDRLTRKTAILVCCDCKSEKFVKAEEWRVQCVGIDWLYAAAREGRRPETSAYRVEGARRGDSRTQQTSTGDGGVRATHAHDNDMVMPTMRLNSSRGVGTRATSDARGSRREKLAPTGTTPGKRGDRGNAGPAAAASASAAAERNADKVHQTRLLDDLNRALAQGGDGDGSDAKARGGGGANPGSRKRYGQSVSEPTAIHITMSVPV